MRRVLCLLVAVMSLSACSSASSDEAIAENAFATCGVDAAELDRLLALSPGEFDQDVNGGWRPIAERPGCERAAATLLEMYIEEHAIAPDSGVMHWHAGQLLAIAGDNDAAIVWLEMSRDADVNQIDAAWNLYVDGTLAFLNGDRGALDSAIDALGAQEVSESEKALRRQFIKDNPDAVVPDGFVDEPQNLSVLVGLRTCFDEPYVLAYRCQR